MASSAAILSSSSFSLASKSIPYHSPCASLTFLAGSRRNSSLSLNVAKSAARSSLLHCSFLSSSSSLSLAHSFAGSSLPLGFKLNTGTTTEKRRGLVVRAGKKYALCQTKRNRSRKSLARTHGFRRRMRTTSGRAVLKRRRAKGRWVLCPKSNPSSGKRA